MAAKGATDPLDEIHRRGVAYVRFGIDNPEHYRILFMDRDESQAFSWERMTQAAAFNHMVEAVQRCVDAELITGDAFAVTLGLWATAHGITSLLIAKPDFPWPPVDELVDHILSAAVYGLTTSRY